MSEEEIDALAARIRDALADLRPQAVYLFGSFARRLVDEWSDLDLVVVMETDRPFFERALPVLKRLDALRPKRGVDLLVYTPAEWERKVRNPYGVTYMVLKEGIPIHERAATA